MVRRLAIWEMPDGGWRLECLSGFRTNDDIVVTSADDALSIVRLQDKVDTLRFREPYMTVVEWRLRTGIGRVACARAEEQW
jgi:hypothetical protein